MVPSDLFFGLMDKAIDGITWLFASLDIVSLLDSTDRGPSGSGLVEIVEKKEVHEPPLLLIRSLKEPV